MENNEQMRAAFLKSVIALGLDRTYDGQRFVNQRTDDTWRGYKFAMSSLPRMTEEELAQLIEREVRSASSLGKDDLWPFHRAAHALIARFPQIVKETTDDQSK